MGSITKGSQLKPSEPKWTQVGPSGPKWPQYSDVFCRVPLIFGYILPCSAIFGHISEHIFRQVAQCYAMFRPVPKHMFLHVVPWSGAHVPTCCQMMSKTKVVKKGTGWYWEVLEKVSDGDRKESDGFQIVLDNVQKVSNESDCVKTKEGVICCQEVVLWCQKDFRKVSGGVKTVSDCVRNVPERH